MTEGYTEELLFIDTRGDVIEGASSHRWEKAGIRADSGYCPVWDGPGVGIGNGFRRIEHTIGCLLPTSTFILEGVHWLEKN